MRTTTKEDFFEFSFQEGECLLTLTEEGLKYQKGEEEQTIPYSDVTFSRALSYKRADDLGREKLYMTAPFPYPCNYNRYCFKKEGETYLTHEFSAEEKAQADKAIEEFAIAVAEKPKPAAAPVKPPMKVFREDGGISHRIFAIALFVFVALAIGAAIMFVINHFLHTATDMLAIVFAIFCVPCLVIVVVKSQELGSKIKVYEKGVYLKIRRKSGFDGTTAPVSTETVYFNWDDVECVERVQSQVQYRVVFRLSYCAYSVPDFDGLYDYIKAHFPELCEGEE